MPKQNQFLELLETLTKLAKDWMTHWIAITIVGVALVLLSRQLWDPTEADLKTAQGIAAIVGPWVGVVIGFYFGERGGAKQAEAAEVRSHEIDEKRKGVVDTAGKRIEELEDELEGILKLLRDAGL